MDHNLTLFLILYGVSMIPYIVTAIHPFNKEVEQGLLLIDLALTLASFYFLSLAIGWWFLLVMLAIEGVGKVLRGSFNYKPYSTLRRKKKENVQTV